MLATAAGGNRLGRPRRVLVAAAAVAVHDAQRRSAAARCKARRSTSRQQVATAVNGSTARDRCVGSTTDGHYSACGRRRCCVSHARACWTTTTTTVLTGDRRTAMSLAAALCNRRRDRTRVDDDTTGDRILGAAGRGSKRFGIIFWVCEGFGWGERGLVTCWQTN